MMWLRRLITGLSLGLAWVSSHAGSCGIWGGQSGTWTGFSLSTSVSLCQYDSRFIFCLSTAMRTKSRWSLQSFKQNNAVLGIWELWAGKDFHIVFVLAYERVRHTLHGIFISDTGSLLGTELYMNDSCVVSGCIPFMQLCSNFTTIATLVRIIWLSCGPGSQFQDRPVWLVQGQFSKWPLTSLCSWTISCDVGRMRQWLSLFQFAVSEGSCVWFNVLQLSFTTYKKVMEMKWFVCGLLHYFFMFSVSLT